MFEITVLAVFLGLVILLALTVYGLGSAIKRQANKPTKRFFAPVPRPGSFSFPALEGKVVDIIENVAGWKTERIPTLSNARCFVIGPREDGSFLENHLGVRWIGIFETIKVIPDWKWSELKQVEVEEGGEKVLKYAIVPREEPVSQFFFQFLYPVSLEGAEIAGNMRVRIIASFIVLHFHPVRSFFLNKDPVTVFNTMVLSALRDYVRDKSFNDVKAIKASITGGGDQEGTFWRVLRDLNGVELREDGTPDYENANPLGLFGKLGDVIVRGEVLQVDTTGPAADALEAQRLAELRGNAKVTEAEKVAQALVVAAQGRMDAAERDAIAQRRLNEQNAGYFASLPGGARMFAAAQVSSKDSSVSTWVEGEGKIDTTLPLPIAPPVPKEPERVKSTESES